MRIGLDCRSIYKGMGGIGRYAWCLLSELAALDRENEYVCYFTHLEPHAPIELPERFRIRKFKAGMIDERFDQLILPALLEEDRLDVYHNSTFSVPAIRTSAKTVATIHDVVFRRHPDLVEPGLRAYLDRATRRACRTADRIVTVSEFSKKELCELYPVSSERVQVIHNGVSTPPLVQSRMSQGKSNVLYVGSIEPKKNIELLLKAFSLLREGPLRLVLAGSRGCYPLEQRIKEFGLGDSVVALGYVSESELESLYANALVFVYPSHYEGFGLPPLEAMARGVPTVVSNSSSLPEVVGEGAVLVDPKDAEGLAKILVRLAKDEHERRTWSERGKVRAATMTWKTCARTHLDLYQSLLTQ